VAESTLARSALFMARRYAASEIGFIDLQEFLFDELWKDTAQIDPPLLDLERWVAEATSGDVVEDELRARVRRWCERWS
jgi:hypothetical protein